MTWVQGPLFAFLSLYWNCFPLLFDFDDYRYFDIERGIERFAEEEGIPVASLTSGFLGRDAESLWVASNDQHPNEEGHRIAADTLYPHIQAMISDLASVSRQPSLDPLGR